MASNSYPDPTASQMPSSTGPFYGKVENEMQIAAELSRNAVPFNHTDDQQQGVHAHHGNPHSLLLNEHEATEQEIARQLQEHTHAQYVSQRSPRDDSPDGSNKKRAKATRACDECRRKKIKCDAANESGEIPCSNCKRTTAQCQFSRNPQKRGPNKGYIKELSDRVASLEQQQVTGRHSATAPQFLSGQRMQIPIDQNLTELQAYNSNLTQPSRKRSFSLSQGPHDASPNKRSEYLHGLENHEEALFGDSNVDAALGDYYRAIHPSLPILPSRNRLLEIINSCTSEVREAFFYSVTAATSAEQNIAQHAARLLASPENLPTASRPALLLHLASLVFLHMASDLLGPGGIFGDTVTQPKWLHEAVWLASSLKLNRAVDFNDPVTADTDSDYGIGRRLFWIIYILDRFYAAGYDTPRCLDTPSAFLHAEDERVLGSSIFQLAGVCSVMGDAVSTIQHRYAMAPELAKDVGGLHLEKSDAAVNEILISKTNQILTSSTNEIATLARYHTRLYIIHSVADSPPTTKLDLVCDIVPLIRRLKTPWTALHHHFMSLATSVLFELLEVNETSVSARACLEDLQNTLSEVEPGFWERHIRSAVANKLSQQGLSIVDSNANKQGLQHLADAAIKEGQGAEGSSDVAAAIRKAEAEARLMDRPEEAKLGGYFGALM